LLHNRGYTWFTDEEAARRWAEVREGKRNAEDMNLSEGYYFRTFPVFEAPVGKHDWLTKTVILGSGQGWLVAMLFVTTKFSERRDVQ
jgi:Protein of unknown function (DUF3237)